MIIAMAISARQRAANNRGGYRRPLGQRGIRQPDDHDPGSRQKSKSLVSISCVNLV